jgi:hypothetical protein
VQRVREISLAMVRLTLLGAGAVACLVLALNPGFVALWTGPASFGGLTLNTLLAMVVLGFSLVHSLFTSAATLGQRVEVGWATLAQGVVHVAAALLLGRFFGVAGVAAAAVLSSFAVAYPMGVRVFFRATGLTHADLWRDAVGPWARRLAPLLVLGLAVGVLTPPAARWVPILLSPLLGVLYGWTMRPLLRGIPLPGWIEPWMVRLRLVAG